MDLEQFGLPESIQRGVKFTPMEDLMLAILREAHPDVKFYSLIPNELHGLDSFVLVRRGAGIGTWNGRPHLMDQGNLIIHVYTRDPDGDAKGALVSEAIRNSLERAWQEQKYYPGLGHVVKVTMIDEPTRKTDWVTATGPVQFADLPTGFYRYETRFRCTIRPALWG